MSKKEPDNKGTKTVDFNDAAFMQALDEQVSPAVKQPETVKEVVQEQIPEKIEESPVSDNKEVIELSPDELDWLKDKYGLVDKKRYDDSSEEGKRLNRRLKEVEEYVPLVNQIASNPKLQKMILSELEGGNVSQSVSDSLNIPTDFVYDADEAIRNPASLSGKVFRAEVEKAANQIVSQQIKQLRAEQEKKTHDDRMQTEARLFKDKFKVDDNEFGKMIDWSKNNPIDLESIYYLYTRKDRDKKVAESAIKDKISQMQRVGATPRSLASKGAQIQDKSEDDQVFEAILNAKKVDLFS